MGKIQGVTVMNNEKELSLVVFGASGFTGRLVADISQRNMATI